MSLTQTYTIRMFDTQPRFTPPPRRVPLSLAIANMFNGIAQIGWFVFGFGMIFVWGFVANGDFSFLTFRGPFEQARARVTSVDDTRASENHSTIYANHYEYSVAGEPFAGTSYSTGNRPTEGETVEVEYAPSNPARSRIVGMRRAMFGPFVAFVLIFPLIGFALLYGGFVVGRNRNDLLRNGAFAYGTLTGKRPTNVTVNKRRVFELTFAFTAQDGRQWEAKARSSMTEKLEDEAQEPLLYDPNDPEKAFVLDEAPARPRFNENGEMTGRPAAAIALLILPAIVIVGHGLVLVAKLR